MLPLERAGYTKEEVKDALHGKYAPRNINFRYDLLDKNDNKIKTLDSVESGEVSMASLAYIKRTARFRIKDKGDINYLSDRIQPFARLKMPEVKRRHDDYALEFDGVDDYIIPPTKGLGTGDVSHTIESWVYLYDPPPSRMGILDIKPQGTGGHHWLYNANGTILIGRWNGGAYSMPSAYVPKNRWFHLAATFDLPTRVFKVYVDGVFINSKTLTSSQTFAFSGGVVLGDGVPSELNLRGKLNDVRLWNVARTQQQIQANMNADLKGTESGLVGLWQFREGNGTTAYDSTDNANHGTINGAAWQKNGIWVETIPPKNIEFPLGVFLLSSPTRSDKNKNVYRDVEAYDGLLILKDDKFADRYTITAGTNYRKAVIDILNSAGITKHNIDQTDKVLATDIDFEPGKEKLFAINQLLRDINYTPIYVDVYGYYTSATYRSPSIRSAEYTYKDDSLSVTYAGMQEELDLFNVPNKWVVVMSNPERAPLVSSYTNDNPNSPTSTVNRGRTIVDYREIDNIADQQALDAYVQRIAFEASQIYGKVTFETAIMPMHGYADILELDYSPLNLKGKYAETNWTIPLQSGARMRHEVRKVVTI